MKTLIKKIFIGAVSLLIFEQVNCAFANDAAKDCKCDCPNAQAQCDPLNKATKAHNKEVNAASSAKVAENVKLKKEVTTAKAVTEMKSTKPAISEAKLKAKSTPWVREGYYFEAKGGIDIPSKNTDNFKKFKTDNGALFEIRGGYNFKDFAVDLAIAHSSRNKLHLNDVEDIFAPNDQFKHRGKIKFTTFSLNAYYNIFNIAGFTPYIGAGAGIARNKTSSLVVTSTADLNTGLPTPNGEFVFYKSRQGRTTNNFMWQATVGGRFNMTKDLDLSLEYKYMDLGRWKQGGATAILANGIETDKIQKSKLKAQSVLVGVRYYF